MAQDKFKSSYPPIKGIGTLVREGEIEFVHIDRQVFVKSSDENKKLSAIRTNHKNALKKCGQDPRKVFNHGSIKL